MSIKHKRSDIYYIGARARVRKIMRKPKKTQQTPTISNAGPPEFDWSYFSPVEIKVYGNFDRAFKSFRMLVQSEKVLSLYKEKQAYEKPSDKKRRKKNEAMQKVLEAEMKQKKIISGEYEKEKIKKQLQKEKRRRERDARRDPETE